MHATIKKGGNTNKKDRRTTIIIKITIDTTFLVLNFLNDLDEKDATIPIAAAIEYKYPNWYSAIPNPTKKGCIATLLILIN